MTNSHSTHSSSSLASGAFEGTVNGHCVGLYQITSQGGICATVCNYGARVVQLLAPTTLSESLDMVVSLPNLEALRSDRTWMGAFIGRFANRIGGARLIRGNNHWQLSANEGMNNLHSGYEACSQQVFQVINHEKDKLVMRCLMPHDSDGFPGEVELTLTYQVDDISGLSVAWKAGVSKAATVCNFTSHIYFNLSGQGGNSVVSDHLIQIPANHVLELDSQQVPTGKLTNIKESALDFRNLRKLNSIRFDHYWITGTQPGALMRQARLESPKSGFALDVWSSEPGLQFYAGGALGGNERQVRDQYGRIIVPGSGCCLEPSGYPDAPSHPHFPDPWVEAGDTREGRIEYRISRI